MALILDVEIPGRVVAWKRARPGAGHGKPITQKEAREYGSTLEDNFLIFTRTRGIEVPLRLALVVFVPRPNKRKFWAPVGTPDVDNYAKMVADALERAGIIRNDAQIVEMELSKRYAAEGCGPSLRVKLWEAFPDGP